MIPVSTLYDEYIERRKFTEQKNPFEYIVPPPSRGSEQQAAVYDKFTIDQHVNVEIEERTTIELSSQQ